jgi:phosphoribosylcarboxyaminoimidazole (NCAIR) mutase
MASPFVAILMGSDSDLPIMKSGSEVLHSLGGVPVATVAIGKTGSL